MALKDWFRNSTQTRTATYQVQGKFNLGDLVEFFTIPTTYGIVAEKAKPGMYGNFYKCRYINNPHNGEDYCLVEEANMKKLDSNLET